MINLTYEKAIELFYNDEDIQSRFDFWEIDNAIATIRNLKNDIDNILQEQENGKRKGGHNEQY